MTFQEFTADELLGPFNEIEQKHAPEKLYVAGDVGILDTGPRVSIVGSRKASELGIQRSQKLVRLLMERTSAVIVSGLAAGIDTAAHTAVIEQGGRTIAVIGTPLDRAYPKQNEALQDTIMREHLCVSQFAIGSSTGPWAFPARNRTMALISDATVIIEATEKSGTQHQGWEALRLGRRLYIAKSLMDDPSVTWTSKMQEYGAETLADETLDQLVESLPARIPDASNVVPF